MNPMLAALQKSRSSAPEGPGRDLGADGAPQTEAPEGPGDALLAKLSALEAKIDKICAAMNLDGHDGKEPAAKESTEATPNDDGY